MLHFYVEQLEFAIVSEYDRPERNILINLKTGELTRTLYQTGSPEQLSSPCPACPDQRHLAFKSGRCRVYLAKLDQLGIENTRSSL